MTTWLHRLAVAGLAALVTACGGDSAAKCSLAGGAVLAETMAWPKFRRDMQNTGRTDVEISASAGIRRLFPAEGESALPIATTPILGTVFRCSGSQQGCAQEPNSCPEGETCDPQDGIYFASSDGQVYVLDLAGQRVTFEEDDMSSEGSITSSPLIGQVPDPEDPETINMRIFIATGSGYVRQYRSDASIVNSRLIGGFISASPNIGLDGTVYVGSLGGVISGVCPNGVPRFSLLFAPTQSSAAIRVDPTDPESSEEIFIIYAANDGQVRALDTLGRQRWVFFASSKPIVASVLLDASSDQFYAADMSGRVFAGNAADGMRVEEFTIFQAASGISASPALGRDALGALYVADDAEEGGTLYALDRRTGTERWRFRAEGAILSSPAVATGGETDVVVFGTNDGMVYAIADEGTEPVEIWRFDTGAPVGQSSPSIGSDGTVYIGNEQGELYEIGAPAVDG